MAVLGGVGGWGGGLGFRVWGGGGGGFFFPFFKDPMTLKSKSIFSLTP